MPQELIDQKFDEILWTFNSIQQISREEETKLRIAFQEGIIKASEFFLEKFKKIAEK